MRLSDHNAAPRNTRLNWSLINRVLLIRLRSIGDTVLLTPCLAALKAWRPDIEIEVLSEPLAAPLLEHHPLVDRLIVADPTLTARVDLLARLRARNYDAAFNLHGGTTATLVARLCGARYTIGYAGFRQSWLLTDRAPAPDEILGRKEIHSVEQQLALLHWSGVPWPTHPVRLGLAVSPEAQNRLQQRLAAYTTLTDAASQGDFAVMAPAAALPSKQWRADGFAMVADYVREEFGLPAIIVAGVGQEAIAEQVAQTAHSRPIVLTDLSLPELMALLESSRIFIGNDSGPAHIAAAFHRPLVVIFGSSNPEVWHPWTDAPYRVVQAAPRTQPIASITNEAVCQALDEVWREAMGGRDDGKKTGLKNSRIQEFRIQESE